MVVEKTKVHHRLDAIKTPIGRLSYARDLFKPRTQEEGKAPKYGCTLIYELKDRPFFEALLVKLIRETPGWGEKAIERFKKGMIKNPILAGDGKEAHNKRTGDMHLGMGPGVFFIRPNANEERPPFVIWKSPNKQETLSTVYSGCYGKGALNIYSYTHPKSGDGISFGLEGFQKFQEGEPLGGSGSADPSQYYETIADDGSAPASTTSGAGASGLFGEG